MTPGQAQQAAWQWVRVLNAQAAEQERKRQRLRHWGHWGQAGCGAFCAVIAAWTAYTIAVGPPPLWWVDVLRDTTVVTNGWNAVQGARAARQLWRSRTERALAALAQ